MAVVYMLIAVKISFYVGLALLVIDVIASSIILSKNKDKLEGKW
jgi:hypothetical protein